MIITNIFIFKDNFFQKGYNNNQLESNIYLLTEYTISQVADIFITCGRYIFKLDNS